MPFYSIAFALALLFTGFYYKAGVEETGSGMLWGGMSLVLSMLLIFQFAAGALVILLAQVALALVIAGVRVWREPR